MERNSCSREETFNRLLLGIVDETLSCLGDSGKQSFYYHLDKKFGLKKDEIPHRIGECAKVLEAVLGRGAFLLEGRIMRRLHAKARLVVDCCAPQDVELAAYVAVVRASFLQEDENVSGITLSADLDFDTLVLRNV